MKLLIGTLPLYYHLFFYWLAKHPTIRVVLHISAYLALYVLGTIISIHIYDVLIQDLVFMTSIHGIFTKSIFSYIRSVYRDIHFVPTFVLHYYKYRKWSAMKCNHRSSVIHAKKELRERKIFITTTWYFRFYVFHSDCFKRQQVFISRFIPCEYTY